MNIYQNVYSREAARSYVSRSILVISAVLVTQQSVLAAAQSGDTHSAPVLANLTLDQLNNIQISIATKRPTTILDTPAAATVITGEEVLEMGVTQLPDALRYVPGMDVGNVNSSQWSVSSRGFNGQFANLLLVMIDGRPAYDPSYGGVIWLSKQMMMEDLQRIEVVRGPGGALWGANAVNGVVNFISKNSHDTLGTLISASIGDYNPVSIRARQGFELSSNTDARIFASYEENGKSPMTNGDYTQDSWQRMQAGFRLDSSSSENKFTAQGDAHHVTAGAVFPFANFTPPTYATNQNYDVVENSANLLGRWTREFSSQSTLAVQTYYDFYESLGLLNRQRMHTFDLEAQHDATIGDTQQVTSGFDYRLINDTRDPTAVLRYPNNRVFINHFASVFLQDRIALVKRNNLFLTLGAKLEHDEYSGWNFDPNIRVHWRPSKAQTVWVAVSRAAATANHLSTGVEFDVSVAPPNSLRPGSPATLRHVHGESYDSEKLQAWEAGYRLQPNDSVALDIAAFINDYSDLRILQPTAPSFTSTPPTLPIHWINGSSGRTKGVEISLAWQLLNSWRMQANYSWFDADVAFGSLGRGDGASAPKHKFSLRSTIDMNTQWQWSTGVRYVDRLVSLNVPSYWECDSRLAWTPSEHWEVQLVGQNLLHDNHIESTRGVSPIQSAVPRSVYGGVTWRYK